jgi:hypothetical protein
MNNNNNFNIIGLGYLALIIGFPIYGVIHLVEGDVKSAGLLFAVELIMVVPFLARLMKDKRDGK